MEGKESLIKGDMPRDKNLPGDKIKTSIPFVLKAIAEEDTFTAATI